MQIGVYTSSILNGGERYNAHLLRSVKKFYTNEIVYEYNAQVVDSVAISQTSLTTLKSGMRRVITQSSALSSYFASIGVPVGGKTGTAEVAGKSDYALFTGFAPFDDPEIIGICVIEEGQSGVNASIPIRDIFKTYFAQTEAKG